MNTIKHYLFITLMLSSSFTLAKSQREILCKEKYLQCEDDAKLCKRNFEMCKRDEAGFSCASIYELRKAQSSIDAARSEEIMTNVAKGFFLAGVVPSLPFAISASMLSHKQDLISFYGRYWIFNDLINKGQIVVSPNRPSYSVSPEDYITRDGHRFLDLYNEIAPKLFGFGKGQFCEDYPKLWSFKKVRRHLKKAFGKHPDIITSRSGRIVDYDRHQRKLLDDVSRERENSSVKSNQK